MQFLPILVEGGFYSLGRKAKEYLLKIENPTIFKTLPVWLSLNQKSFISR